MNAIRGLALVVGRSIRVSPWQSLICLAEAAGKLLMAFTPLFLGWLVDGAIHHDAATMVRAVAALVTATGCNYGLQMVGTNARITQMERVGFAFDTDVCRFSSSIPTLDHLDDHEYLDRVQILLDNKNVLGQALNQVLNTINNLAYIATAVLVAATADWRMLIVLVAGVPRLIVTSWAVRWEREAEQQSGAPSRLANRLLTLTTTVDAGAEIRVFGLAAPLRRRLRAAVNGRRAPYVRLANRYAAVELANVAFFYGITIAVLAWIVFDAIGGRVQVSALVVALAMVGTLQTIAMFVSGTFQGFSRTLRNVDRYLWLRDYANSAQRADGTARTPPQPRGITLRDVSYRYPGSGTDAIHGLDLDLQPGAIVALVGENGAGKSTLVNLLTGMYQPTSGQITLNGIRSTDIAADDWRIKTTGAFQDFVPFELTAQHAIGVGNLNHVDDPRAVLRALNDASAQDVLTALPTGLASQLGTTWPDGVDLSGGQWQRIALARAFMRQAPHLLVLDEPTSALDAATEHQLFEHYTAAARTGKTLGTITLLVTHRFSTAANADIVVVLQRGQITEIGTHADLIGARGHYGELYAIQAAGYQ